MRSEIDIIKGSQLTRANGPIPWENETPVAHAIAAAFHSGLQFYH